MSSSREYPGQFEVVDHDNGNRRPADSKAQAEDMAETAREFGSENVEVLAPQETDGGEAVPVDTDTDTDTPDLPDKQLSEDPINWVPEHFVDTIEGVPTINRKGYAVIAEHYGIDVQREFVTYPSGSDFEYAEAEATATTEDGATYSGFGSAHVDRGDDPTLLGELAETRAMKRAVAWATGVGMTAVEELQGELNR